MDEFLGAPLPVEVRSTCSDCAMARRPEHACKSDIVFLPNTKCCTFTPELPNFLVGAVLADASPEAAAGRVAFERGALARGVINPLGVFPSTEYSRLYSFNKNNFGRLENLLCPYYMAEEGGLCAIWKHRNGRCSTWFCKHERGSVSVVFWKYIDRLLSAVETALARWCLLKMDLGSRALAELIPASGDPIKRSSVWGNWAGREREFFMECASAVEALSWKEVWNITGPEIHVLARLTADSFREWQNPRIPERLRYIVWKVEHYGNLEYRVWGYSKFDPIDLSYAILEALPLFDGTRSTAENVARIESEFGIQLDNALLQKLCDVRILVEREA